MRVHIKTLGAFFLFYILKKILIVFVLFSLLVFGLVFIQIILFLFSFFFMSVSEPSSIVLE